MTLSLLFCILLSLLQLLMYSLMLSRQEKLLRLRFQEEARDTQVRERELRQEILQGIRDLGQLLKASLDPLREHQKGMLEGFAQQLQGLTDRNQEAFQRMDTELQGGLHAMKEGQQSHWERLQELLESNYRKNLELRLSQTRDMILERLDKMHQGLGDLRRILGNVKSRGLVGEQQLASLLEDCLSKEQYAANVAIVPQGRERVDFAVRLPGEKGDKSKALWLPIDAKFPQEDYQRLLQAQEEGDMNAVKQAGQALEQSVKRQARSIKSKYVHEDFSTPFAILFVPTEGLYGELLRRPGLQENLQKEHRIVLAGPGNLYALLSSLRLGLRSMAIAQHSREIWLHLAGLQSQFSSFLSLLESAQKKLASAAREVDRASEKSRSIQERLSRFEPPQAGVSLPP